MMVMMMMMNTLKSLFRVFFHIILLEVVCYIAAPVLNATHSVITNNLHVTNSGYTPSIHYH
jgi:hypothetical protein